MFTMFESETVCMMYLLDLCFSQLEVFKPATSKEGNSEVYVICLDFKRTEWLEKYLTDTKVSPVTCATYCVGTRLTVSLCSPRPSLYYNNSQSANNPNSLVVGTSSYVFFFFIIAQLLRLERSIVSSATRIWQMSPVTEGLGRQSHQLVVQFIITRPLSFCFIFRSLGQWLIWKAHPLSISNKRRLRIIDRWLDSIP